MSHQFNFLVGPDCTCLSIHAGLVSGLSRPLDALMNNGQMEESTSRCAVLKDTEVDTFISFCEYAYTGQYVTPGYVDGDNEESALKGLPVFIFKGKDIKKPSKRQPNSPRKTLEVALEGILDQNTDLDEDSPKPRILHPYNGLWNDFVSRRGFAFAKLATVSPNPDFLAHAKIYVFATRYLIDKLRMQALGSLHRDLRNFKLSNKNAKRILDLLEYTYKSTGREEPGGKSQLRDLVIHYVACESRLLANNENFRHLLDENGEIGSDLVMKMVNQKPFRHSALLS